MQLEPVALPTRPLSGEGNTAHVTGNAIYILDVFRERLDYPAQRKALIRLARAHDAKVILIEAAANGSPLVADLRQLDAPGVQTPIPFRPQGSKVERVRVGSHRIEAGDVKLPDKAAWLDTFKAEVLAFPYGRYDDQVDALSQLLAWLDQKWEPRVSLFGPVVFVDGIRQ